MGDLKAPMLRLAWPIVCAILLQVHICVWMADAVDLSAGGMAAAQIPVYRRKVYELGPVHRGSSFTELKKEASEVAGKARAAKRRARSLDAENNQPELGSSGVRDPVYELKKEASEMAGKARAAKHRARSLSAENQKESARTGKRGKSLQTHTTRKQAFKTVDLGEDLDHTHSKPIVTEKSGAAPVQHPVITPLAPPVKQLKKTASRFKQALRKPKRKVATNERDRLKTVPSNELREDLGNITRKKQPKTTETNSSVASQTQQPSATPQPTEKNPTTKHEPGSPLQNLVRSILRGEATAPTPHQYPSVSFSSMRDEAQRLLSVHNPKQRENSKNVTLAAQALQTAQGNLQESRANADGVSEQASKSHQRAQEAAKRADEQQQSCERHNQRVQQELKAQADSIQKQMSASKEDSALYKSKADKLANLIQSKKNAIEKIGNEVQQHSLALQKVQESLRQAQQRVRTSNLDHETLRHTQDKQSKMMKEMKSKVQEAIKMSARMKLTASQQQGDADAATLTAELASKSVAKAKAHLEALKAESRG